MIPITPKVREYLEKNIAEDIPWYYAPEYVFAMERARYWNARVSNLGVLLSSQCNHIKKEVTTEYFKGSYLDRAYTKYTVKCMRCKATLFQDHETHDWYG